MYLGVDYYPEHWDLEVMENDLLRIVEMGANMVRIGEFAWHLMEPKEGEFDFSFFDKVIIACKLYGLKVMFGTPTATFPAWLATKYPEILSKDIQGNKRVFGGRRQYCFSSKKYREYSIRITQKLVNHYQNEQQIVAWQVDNEFGHEGSDMCYCQICHQEFHSFLKRKFENIEKLNKAYGTIFWGQTYNSFEEIPIPKSTITTHNPALRLDWLRFRSFILNLYVLEQIALVRKYKGQHQQITTNASGGFFDKYFDHAEHFRQLDFSSYDNYPVWGGLEQPLKPHEIAMNLDLMRGLRKENFWIVEQLMGAQGHDVIGYLPRPNQALAWAHQAFGRGCNNMLWFRWRAMTRGAEQFCFGIIDHDDSKGRKYQEVRSYIKYMEQYSSLVNSPISADVAVLYDYENIWSWKIQRQSISFDFFTEMSHLYRPFYEKNIPIDILPIDSDISDYKVIILPNQMLIDETLNRKLEEFVNMGGRLVISYRAGIKDRDNNAILGQPAPGYLKELVGATVMEIESLGLQNTSQVLYNNQSYETRVWRDMLRVDTAEAVVRYTDEYDEFACVTCNHFGSGKVFYIGSSLDESLMDLLCDKILEGANIETMDTETDVEVMPRFLNDKKYLFITNHSGEWKTFRGKTIEPYGFRIEEA